MDFGETGHEFTDYIQLPEHMVGLCQDGNKPPDSIKAGYLLGSRVHINFSRKLCNTSLTLLHGSMS
jgi:hypothetical protein